MTIEKLREYVRAAPFQRFTLYMADGRIAKVEHPDFIAYSPGSRTACVYEPDGSYHIIDLSLVTELQVRRDDTMAM